MALPETRGANLRLVVCSTLLVQLHVHRNPSSGGRHACKPQAIGFMDHSQITGARFGARMPAMRTRALRNAFCPRRLSLRSFVYTCTFFAAGIAACSLGGTLAALGVAPAAPPYIALTGAALRQGLAILGTAVAGTAAAGAIAARTQNQNVGVVYDAFAGVTFGLGLCFSGMTRPSLVRRPLPL
jgi:hypothetical protein